MPDPTIKELLNAFEKREPQTALKIARIDLAEFVRRQGVDPSTEELLPLLDEVLRIIEARQSLSQRARRALNSATRILDALLTTDPTHSEVAALMSRALSQRRRWQVGRVMR